MQEEFKKRPDSSQEIIKQGIVALCRCQIPLAFSAFQQVYDSSNWQVRDIAVAGFGDLVDVKFYDGQKTASAILAANWQPPDDLPKTQPPIPLSRLMLMVDGFMQDSLFQPQNITEAKFRQTMRESLKLLENILLHDPHYLVRFSALAVLTHVLDEDKQYAIRPILQKARRHETNKLLCDALEGYLGNA